MKKIKPFENMDAAIESLDNGGHFYNILTKADDGVISRSELGKVGGIFSDKQQIVLFLEMSLLAFRQADKELVLSKLDKSLSASYLKFKSQVLLPSEAKKDGIVSSNAIITGIPKLVDSQSDFVGFIMFPIMSGDVPTMMMVPMTDEYDVYELRDDESSDTFLIAHTKDEKKLPNEKIILGGVIKELQAEKEAGSPAGKFLEVIYYCEF